MAKKQKKKNKPSRHGTLDENDLDGAAEISVNAVLQHCFTPTTKDIFGQAGALPPKSARKYEPRYIVYHSIKDSKTGENWVGLNRVTNTEKGTVGPIVLVPGEYKIELKLSKETNKNLVHEAAGGIIGGLGSLGLDEERAKEVSGRGLPNSYVDVHFNVQAKRYGIADTRGILDLGLHNSFSRVFSVRPEDGDATFELKMYSHSVLKRMKVSGNLYRRDFPPPEEQFKRPQNAAKRGKEILKKALSSGEAQKPQVSRLEAGVDVHDVVRRFYEKMAPERLGNLKVVFKHFEGRDEDLLSTLEAKYNCQIDPKGNITVN